MGDKIDEIIRLAVERGASDAHIVSDCRVMLRVSGRLEQLSEECATGQEIKEWLKRTLGETQAAELRETGELEFSCSVHGGSRVRISVFRQAGAYALVAHTLMTPVPRPDVLGVPDVLTSLTGKRSGLVLVAGEAGSGRSTTVASLLEKILQQDARSVLTIEKPVEYLYPQACGLAVQREVGADTRSYADALQAAQRQDADVIFVGELLDAQTMSLAVAAAETGHLVFSQLQANSVQAVVDRMVEAYLPHQQQKMRERIANVLEGAVVQQLIPRLDGAGRMAAFEVLLATPQVRSLIQDGKSDQLSKAMQNGRKEGMQTMDGAICDLYMRSCISPEAAVAYAQDRTQMQRNVGLF